MSRHQYSILRLCRGFVLPLIATVLLCSCGGGSEQGASSKATSNADVAAYNQMMSTAPTENEARRFLSQATFGPTDQDVSAVMQVGYAAWLERQIQMPWRPEQHLSFFNDRMVEARAINSAAGRDSNFVVFSAWKSFLTNDDQLRQRVAFALSQIFVVSLLSDCLNAQPQAVASYADMLTAHAFGTYRQLLESIAKHPAMGCYLSHLKNRKEDFASGRQPDENFAREVMQLFSIGLYRLNADGTPILDSDGLPQEIYTSDDVKGLAKVFTGFSFSCGSTSTNCFWRGIDSSTGLAPENIWTKPMMLYPAYHSTSEKRFLGVVVEGNTSGGESMRIALDTLANHPNVAPFISRQLIQRLVTSNPSPGYIGRVSSRFSATNGNLGEAVKAVLLDKEARLPAFSDSASFGKLREPVLRLTALLRATGMTSLTGGFQLARRMPSAFSLGQVPYMSQSVFNFYRPGYVFPGSALASNGLVAPEFQLLDETSLASYVNFMQGVVYNGVGANVDHPDGSQKPDIRPNYLELEDDSWLRSALDVESLIDHIDSRLLYGGISDDLRSIIREQVSRIAIPLGVSDSEVLDLKRKRLRAALLLTMASSDFLVQR